MPLLPRRRAVDKPAVQTLLHNVTVLLQARRDSLKIVEILKFPSSSEKPVMDARRLLSSTSSLLRDPTHPLDKLCGECEIVVSDFLDPKVIPSCIIQP
ncbi:hypothetical protein F7725_005724 [Dissostichus mawsoni]|uniref:Uncharacterized protein n=1 Tax=Dissostichus mawsoni TaxID=36200 RepID=A0A7J5YUI8_DISMA|nr:hypothetical protein F7725_005724 [Dissostichus mawsoni]